MGEPAGATVERRPAPDSAAASPHGATAEHLPAPASEGVTDHLALLAGGRQDGAPLIQRLTPVQRPQTLLALQRTVGNAAVQRLMRPIAPTRPPAPLMPTDADHRSAPIWRSPRDGGDRPSPPAMIFRLVIERDDTDDASASDAGASAVPTAPSGPVAMTAQMTGLWFVPPRGTKFEPGPRDTQGLRIALKRLVASGYTPGLENAA